MAACRIIYPQWWFLARPTLAAQIVVALVAWVVLTPLVLGTNAAVNIVFSILDWQRDTHPLAKLGGRSIQESVLFFFQACIAAPIVEEAIFRGAILAWLIGGRKPLPTPDVPQRLRSWLVVLIALLFTSLSMRDGAIVLSGKEGATIFTLLLIVGLAAVNFSFRTKRRTLGGIYTSAALFAVIHSGIWPSPIPLFLLGLGLGWLAVRTRGILVPIIVHGLFNAVSTVFVLMQPAMN
jgi:membrane protease YdiL (CAAX protease family)